MSLIEIVIATEIKLYVLVIFLYIYFMYFYKCYLKSIISSLVNLMLVIIFCGSFVMHDSSSDHPQNKFIVLCDDYDDGNPIQSTKT